MRKLDEVFKLITLKKVGINVDIPEHLQQEFDERWSKQEIEKAGRDRKNKLLQNPLSVETFKIATLQREPAEYVLFEDYKFVVGYLEQQLSRAWSDASYGRYDSSTSWRD